MRFLMSATHPNTVQQTPSGKNPGARTSGAQRGREHRSWSRLGVPAGLAVLCLWALIAFSGFVRDVDALAAPSPVSADAIVVVTGGSARIEVALQLLQDGAARRLLISGVNSSTDVATLVMRTQADPALFECCVDLDHEALDTAGNAREAAAWASEHGFASLLVVTSSYHIPRTTREMAQLLPGVDLVPFPIDPATNTQRASAQEPSSWPVSLLAREFVKLQLARVRHLVGSAG